MTQMDQCECLEEGKINLTKRKALELRYMKLQRI